MVDTNKNFLATTEKLMKDFNNLLNTLDPLFLLDFIKEFQDTKSLEALIEILDENPYFANIKSLIVTLQNFQPVETVQEVDLDKYVGRWEQVMASPLSLLITERGGTQNIATYERLIDPNNISVLNQQINLLGQPNDIRGVGTLTGPGKLDIQFQGIPTKGKYWILDLGEVLNDQYQWAIVSDPYRLFLFVLARDQKLFWDNYATLVEKKLENLGFSYAWNIPIKTV